ncbi:MAG: glycine--tRNA ligase subunit beta [Firmicutes bacterium]|nr:glycine--tRNA ligase subunit beta [Bacillota bacterium]
MSGLLVEVGVEELPSRDVARASAALAEALAAAVRELGLGGGEARAYGTPRRLAAYVADVAERQAVEEREVRGPSAAHAYDGEGRPTPALLGFCRSQGVEPERVRVVETPGGAYVMARVRQGGRPARDLLPERVAAVLADLPFARTMRWGEGTVRFGRPVVWLVCLLGREVVPVTFAGVAAGRESRGHRFLAPGPVPLGAAEDYEDRLRDAFVLADRAGRRAAVRRAVEAAAAAEGLEAEVDEGLLDEVTDLVELPTAFVGRFSERYLALPDAALTTPMIHHQRQFPTRRREDGARANAFVGVRNGDTRRLDLVRAGNERVLAARLADAWFFFERDRATPLEEMRRRLATMELGGGLGSMLDRADRVEAIAAALGRWADEGERQGLERAAHLVFADRASLFVGEFPELGGVMGEAYAAAAGEDPGVARALSEAVRPRDADDRLPARGPGRLLALAARAEELVAGWLAGRAPTGSEDPFGLRRAALALSRIGMAGGVPGGLERLVATAAEAFASRFGADERAAARNGVLAFVRDRVAGLVVEAGVPPAVAQAVCAAGVDGPDGVLARARALEAALEEEGGDALLTAYRRAARLVRQAGAEAAAGEEVAQAAPGAEAALAAAVSAAEEAAGDDLADRDPARYFRLVASLAPSLDAFFRDVMVLDPDPQVRRRRLALLVRVVRLASRGADLSLVGRRREEPVGA